MQAFDVIIHEDLRQRIETILEKRKNLMIYDTNLDGFSELDKNIGLRFFYSSPYNFFDYVTFDIFKKPVNENGLDKKLRYGVISVIKDADKCHMKELDTIYGKVSYETKQIRGNDKILTKLHLNNNGLNEINNLIKYFEDNFCK